MHTESQKLELCKDLSLYLKAGDITVNNAMNTVVMLMRKAEKMALDGIAKKNLVADVIKEYSSDSTEPSIINLMVPNIIDTLIDVEKKKIRIKLGKKCSLLCGWK